MAAGRVGFFCRCVFRLLSVNAQILHKARQESGFEVGIGRGGLPYGRVFVFAAVHFFHGFVGEEDVGNAVFALFDTDDEFVALAGGVDAAQTDCVE